MGKSSNKTHPPKVKITKAAYEKLKKESSELDQKNQELDQRNQELDRKNQELDQKNQELDRKNQEVARLKAKLENRSPVKNKSSSSKKKKELNATLVKHVKGTVKNFVFRYVKFIKNEKEEKLCTRNTLKHLPVTLPAGISKQEFVQDYSDVVYTTIKSTAQVVQHNAKKKAKGMCFVL